MLKLSDALLGKYRMLLEKHGIAPRDALNRQKCNRTISIASRIMLPKTDYKNMWRVDCEVIDEFSSKKRIVG